MQNSYARASSIIKKSDKKNFNKKIKKIDDLDEYEINLIKKISDFPDIVILAEKNMNPSLIANYSYELAKTFNKFYHNCPVIGTEKESLRLRIIDSFRTTMKNSLHLLGIEVMDEM